ncbi:MAG TPA: M43 family zinc metalloprotease [Puia sp.]|nr:M43 family zinc metalloprotease [Puia sp.]
MKPIFYFVALLISFQSLTAQPICGFDGAHQHRMQTDASYRNDVLKYESGIQKYIDTHPNLSKGNKTTNSVNSINGSHSGTLGTALYTIPVVVHVIHTGGAVGTIYNPTDAQILGAINYLNEVYNGTYPGTQGVGDLQIQFAVAQRDPNCNPTNGINRVDGSSLAGYASGGVNSSTTLGTDEINVKNLSRWDPTQYYNIWVVDKIDGADGTSGQFIAGFAYFPGGDPNYDGIIMLATQMVAGQKTLPHEIGHAFNLYHPFQGSPDKNTCPASGSCSATGDLVCDTDPITYNQLGGVVDFTCRTGTNSCTGTGYSINTESNYMNYTNCYTLFTAGQKTRMLASAASTARLSLSTSLGATAPNAGTTQCVPKIDFELASDVVTEATTATSGCRSYTDYTYNMVIGNSPSITATAILNVVSGTATQGTDFDITTNGSFTSPSLVLTFPNGSTTSQPFTVRIYDDASVEGIESFTLGFTVNNGGGNAVLGDGRPNLTITINDNDALPYGPANITKSIGTSAGLLQSPFVGASTKQKSQILYSASELSSAGIAAGSIIGMALNISKNSGTSYVYQGMTIRIAQTTQSSLYNGSTNFPLSDASFTAVYNSNYTTATGWNTFTFTTPFVWDGTSNIVVEICYSSPTTSSTDYSLGYIDGSAYSNYIFYAVDCSTPYSTFSYYPSGEKPIVQFVYADPGTQLDTALSASANEYLGPNTDIYFYNKSNNKLLAHIQNLSNFDYGCTQVIIDRTGTGATQFWNTNTSNYIMNKTFHVIPTNNNSSGSYNVTLYYTPTEVNGWQSATGQSITNIDLIKTTNQISLVTPASPTGAGTMVTGAPAISSLGTITGLTYNFTTGFSGFGAGVIGILLQTQLLNFEGRLNNNYAALNWTTSQETNNLGFSVERSYNGNSFSQIGYVASAGNSSEQQNYSFTDPDMAQTNNYYRLKLIGADSSYQYSNVILLSSSTDGFFKVLNNPFTNQLSIQLTNPPADAIDIRLFDVIGKEIYRYTNTASGSSIINLDLSQKNLSAGMYILEVYSNNERHVAKVVKQ